MCLEDIRKRNRDSLEMIRLFQCFLDSFYSLLDTSNIIAIEICTKQK